MYNEASIEAGCRLIDFQSPDMGIHLDIPCVNASYFGFSELLHEAAKGRKFALGWFRRHDGNTSIAFAWMQTATSTAAS